MSVASSSSASPTTKDDSGLPPHPSSPSPPSASPPPTRRNAHQTPGRTWSRLLWKELRTYRSFFASLLCFGLFLQLVGLIWPGWEFLSLVMPMLFLAGVIGTGFSGEHEAGTYIWLRAQPVDARHIVGAKLGLGLLGAALLAVVLSSLVILRFGRVQMDLKFACDLGVAVLELSAWSLLMSLTDRHPLRAVVLAGCFAAVIGFGLVIGSEVLYGIGSPSKWWLTWLRLGIASVAMAVGLRLSWRWHHRGLTGGSLWGFKSRAARPVALWPQPRAFRALVRFTMRQSWWVLFPILLFALWIQTEQGLMSGTCILATVCGILTFAPMGAERLQFAIHGASPKLVWLVRVGVLATPVLAVLAIVGIAHEWLLDQFAWSELVCTSLAIFFVTQLISINASSTLMAIGYAMPAAIFTGLLVNFCWHGGVPFWVLVAPLIAFTSVATAAASTSWLLRRDDRQTRRRQRWLAWGAVGLSVTGIAGYRWLEIPLLSAKERSQLPIFASQDQPTWKSAVDQIEQLRLDSQWQAFTAAVRSAQVLPNPTTCGFEDAYDFRVPQGLQEEIDSALDRGDSELTADLIQAQHWWSEQSLFTMPNRAQLLAWAHDETTTPEQVLAMRDYFLEHPPSIGVALQKVAWIHAMLARLKTMDRQALAFLGFVEADDEAANILFLVGKLAFWERWRMQRELDRYAFVQSQQIEVIDRRLKQHLPLNSVVRNRQDEPSWLKFLGAAPDWSLVFSVQSHRADVLTMEAIAHYREHGEWPSSTADLAHGASPDFADPFTGNAFQIITTEAGEDLQHWLTSPGSATSDYSMSP